MFQNKLIFYSKFATQFKLFIYPTLTVCLFLIITQKNGIRLGKFLHSKCEMTKGELRCSTNPVPWKFNTFHNAFLLFFALQDGLRRRMDKLKSSIEEANRAVDKEREKNVSLLQLIFPPDIAKRLWLGIYNNMLQIIFDINFMLINRKTA